MCVRPLLLGPEACPPAFSEETGEGSLDEKPCQPNWCFHAPTQTLEQKQADRTETTTAAEARLGHSNQDCNSQGRTRDLALFNLAIDSKLRGCDVDEAQGRARRTRSGYCR